MLVDIRRAIYEDTDGNTLFTMNFHPPIAPASFRRILARWGIEDYKVDRITETVALVTLENHLTTAQSRV